MNIWAETQIDCISPSEQKLNPTAIYIQRQKRGIAQWTKVQTTGSNKTCDLFYV